VQIRSIDRSIYRSINKSDSYSSLGSDLTERAAPFYARVVVVVIVVVIIFYTAYCILWIPSTASNAAGIIARSRRCRLTEIDAAIVSAKQSRIRKENLPENLPSVCQRQQRKPTRSLLYLRHESSAMLSPAIIPTAVRSGVMCSRKYSCGWTGTAVRRIKL